MFHEKRKWCVTPVKNAGELAEKLTENTWTLCTGFELLGYLFLNDATSEDGAQEYAVVKRAEDAFLQVESLTVSWMDPERALVLIDQLVVGDFDGEGLYGPVKPVLETPEVHGRCPFCAS